MVRTDWWVGESDLGSSFKGYTGYKEVLGGKDDIGGPNQSVTSRSREFFIFFMVSEPESKKFGTEKSLGTGLEKILVPKKVSEPVSKNFGTEKSLGIGLEKVWYRKKNIGTSLNFF